MPVSPEEHASVLAELGETKAELGETKAELGETKARLEALEAQFATALDHPAADRAAEEKLVELELAALERRSGRSVAGCSRAEEAQVEAKARRPEAAQGKPSRAASFQRGE